MDLKLKSNIFEYNEEVEIKIKKKHKLDKQGELDQIINIIEEWIKQQPHLKKKKFPKKYLENAVISAKGSIERAKMNIEKLCTLKTMYPEFFQEHDLRKLFLIWGGYYIQSFLPILTDSHCRVFVAKFLRDGTKSHILYSIYKTAALFLEYIKMYDCNDGIIVINDLRNISVTNLLTEVNMSDLRNILTISTEGYALRLKAVHFITSSSATETLLKLFKSIVSVKIGSRVHVHKTYDILHDFISKDVLPIDYGGNELPLQELNDKWIDELTKEENRKLLKEISEACTDEALRPRNNHDEPFMGMVGSFRTLTVD